MERVRCSKLALNASERPANHEQPTSVRLILFPTADLFLDCNFYPKLSIYHQALSSMYKLIFGAVVVSTCCIVYGVHYKRQSERAEMRKNVIRELKELRQKRREATKG